MSTPKKFRFLFQTAQRNNRMSERVLFETDSRDRAAMVRHKLESVTGKLEAARECRKVLIRAVNLERLKLFAPKAKLSSGQVFDSIDALSQAIEANPVTLRAAISTARRSKNGLATVRGVTYAYAA